MNNQPVLIVICGPTASGKTGLSVELARYFNSEVLSADSRQFYKELNIGTAKPTKADQKGIRHHFIDSLGIEEQYSAGDFERDALKLLEDLFKQHKVLIMAGGSGMFINAVCHGLDDFPEVSSSVKEEVSTIYETEGLNGLISALSETDPDFLEKADQSNPHRMIRALEVSLSSGKPFSSFKKNASKSRFFSVLKLSYEWDREMLYQRINQRVDRMLAEGLEDEVRQLLPYRHLNALQTVGYKEWFPYFDGQYEKNEAVRLIKRNTRRYAKRQLTWFRKDESIHYFNPETPVSKIFKFVEDQINVKPTR